MTRFFIIFFLIFNSCNNYKISEKEKLADASLAKTAKKLSKKYGLSPSGTGGQMMDEIKMLYLAFDYRKPLKINEARPIIVDCVKEFINTINTDENIRPYLIKYPFTSKNADIAIFLHQADGQKVPDGDLLITSCRRGKIEYVIRDPITKEHRTIMSESFEQAVSHLQNK